VAAVLMTYQELDILKLTLELEYEQ